MRFAGLRFGFRLTPQRYVENKFTIATKSTIGSDFLSKELEVDGKPVTLQVLPATATAALTPRRFGTPLAKSASKAWVPPSTAEQTVQCLCSMSQDGYISQLVSPECIDLPRRTPSKSSPHGRRLS